MRIDQLTVWARACAQLHARTLLARVYVDDRGLWVEVRKGSLQIKRVLATAQVETAETDIVLRELAFCAAQIELGNVVPVPFKPWIAGGSDVASKA